MVRERVIFKEGIFSGLVRIQDGKVVLGSVAERNSVVTDVGTKGNFSTSGGYDIGVNGITGKVIGNLKQGYGQNVMKGKEKLGNKTD